jgi:hypothetical protein
VGGLSAEQPLDFVYVAALQTPRDCCTLKVVGSVGNVPAIVLAVVLVGIEVELGLEVLKIFGLSRLTHVEQPFLLLSMKAERLRSPAALLEASGDGFGVGVVREEEIMVERDGVGQRLVDFKVDFRPPGTAAEERADTFKHVFSPIQRKKSRADRGVAILAARAGVIAVTL